MTDHEALAHERLRTLIADAIDEPGVDAPYHKAEPVIDRFPLAYFDRTVNGYGVPMRRVHAVGEWEVDPNRVPLGDD